MKILQIVHSLPFLNKAGTEIYAFDLSCELAKRHEVYIFSRANNPKQPDYGITLRQMNGIPVYLINNTLRGYDSFEMYYENAEIDKKFARLLDELKPDVAHIQHLVFLSIGLIRELGERGIPIVFTLHDYWLICPKWHLLKKDWIPCDKPADGDFDAACDICLEELLYTKRNGVGAYMLCKKILPGFIVKHLKRMYFFAQKRTRNSCDAFIKLKERNRKIKELLGAVRLFLAPSQYAMERFIKFGISQDKIKLLKYGINNKPVIGLEKKREKKIRFGFIGTILPAKGVHILIKAFNGVRKENAELKIYGRLHSYAGFEDYPRYLRSIVKNNNIRFMGAFPHQEVVNIFKEIDILVIPSLWNENSPFVIQEAFYFKTPVIASIVGGIPELVKDNINGLLFKSGDINELRERMQYIIDNPNALERFKENMPTIKTIRDNAREMEEIYNKLVINNGYVK